MARSSRQLLPSPTQVYSYARWLTRLYCGIGGSLLRSLKRCRRDFGGEESQRKATTHRRLLMRSCVLAWMPLGILVLLCLALIVGAFLVVINLKSDRGR